MSVSASFSVGTCDFVVADVSAFTTVAFGIVSTFVSSEQSVFCFFAAGILES